MSYDLFFLVPALAEYSIASYILFILTASQFFHEMRTWWVDRRGPVSLISVFVFGFTSMIALGLVVLTWHVGLQQACAGMIASAGAAVLMIFVYVREVPESLID